jgi:hypothetical protein
MPIPPLWFGAAAFALLGALVDPAFYVIGAGATALCAGLVASNARFRRTVDAGDQPPARDEHAALLDRLDSQTRTRQTRLEEQCVELQRILETANAGTEHVRGVWQLAQLHLRLLAARSAAKAVVSAPDDENGEPLSTQITELERRLSQPNLDAELREALEDQGQVLKKRLEIRREARRRLQVLDAELDRIREQVALIREQALLTSDPAGIRRSVDALATFLNESNRWLQDQEQLFGEFDLPTPDPFAPAQSGPQQWQRADKRAGEVQ